jgi:hypothetical protein
MTIIIRDRWHIPAAVEAAAVRPYGGTAGHAPADGRRPSTGRPHGDSPMTLWAG